MGKIHRKNQIVAEAGHLGYSQTQAGKHIFRILIQDRMELLQPCLSANRQNALQKGFSRLQQGVHLGSSKAEAFAGGGNNHTSVRPDG